MQRKVTKHVSWRPPSLCRIRASRGLLPRTNHCHPFFLRMGNLVRTESSGPDEGLAAVSVGGVASGVILAPISNLPPLRPEPFTSLWEKVYAPCRRAAALTNSSPSWPIPG